MYCGVIFPFARLDLMVRHFRLWPLAIVKGWRVPSPS